MGIHNRRGGADVVHRVPADTGRTPSRGTGATIIVTDEASGAFRVEGEGPLVGEARVERPAPRRR
jgi:hypothetical protein